MSHFQIEKKARGSWARAGRLKTRKGEILTPVFMPVGTQATIKTLHPDQIAKLDPSIILANTYHLMIRPGIDVFQKMGGLHKLMNWNRSILTDSGGFQIFSLPSARSLSEEGAVFRSYVDQREVRLTPEKSIEMQTALGSDIMMVLDVCVPSTVEHAVALNAMNQTHRWAKRSLAARKDLSQMLYGIVQGACFQDLREESAKCLSQMPFDGLAVGGLAVGEGAKERNQTLEATTPHLPEYRPRYLMGVGTPLDLLEAVHRGIDQFDCVMPGALAQQGVAFTSQGRVQMRRVAHRLSEEKLDADCDCDTCMRFSRAYIHHLIKADEVLGWNLISFHNIHFYLKFMKEIRKAILENRFEAFYRRERDRIDLTEAEINGAFFVRESPQGFNSIGHLRSGEVMHGSQHPDKEARDIYVEPLKIEEWSADEQKIIWDVGLGAGHNALALIREIEKLKKKARIFSFESDLDAIQLAYSRSSEFPHLHHPAPKVLLKLGEWISPDGLIEWRMVHGDFLECFDHIESPHAIFYDPFSFKTDSELWTEETFKKLFLKVSLAGKGFGLTFSSSTQMRERIRNAGFVVSSSVGTGTRTETTRFDW